ncbi:pollen-specific leucine-rich repeat extensin-like protein 2 isoform X1 [Cyprinodon tularosa]|uniref:pollen-specific leucine-rich repeat extensin-like protein 2 isoform X1 n=2 Tax=Cyprinodon tularosa TaxID=77115 RepID=UPI0018E24224|nr:pollen-specific leucine-rich repeat extensin-like protein 2 isoform X1 [Cyprinodon tularosa]
MIRLRLQALSQLSAARMEETSQQEKIQGAEEKIQNEEEGGIRRRLRDRELLRKRKAEAEEKETNQWVFGVESQRKRSKAENKSGAKRRGRPRKTEPVPQFPVVQEEAGDPAVLVVPVSAEVVSGQILSSQTTVMAVEPQQAPDVDAPAPVPVFGLVQNSSFGKIDVDSAPVQDSVPVPVRASYPAQVPAQAPYAAPGPVQATSAASIPAQAPYVAPDPLQASSAASYTVPIPVQAPSDVLVQFQAPKDVLNDVQAPEDVQVPDAPAIRGSSQQSAPDETPAPPRMETFYSESKSRETFEQVFIEDLGPDDEEDFSPSQNNRADEGLYETPAMNAAEQNKMYSVPTLSSPPLPQEYLPGNQL